MSMRKAIWLCAVLVVCAQRPALADEHGSMRPSGALTDSLALLSSLDLPTLERWVVRQNADAEAARQAYRAALGVPGTTGWEDPMVDFTLGPSSIGNDEFGTAYRIGVRQAIPLGKLGSPRDAAL